MSDVREPPLDDELAEMIAKKASEIVKLADIRERHQRRKAAVNPHPPFSALPEAG